MCGNCFDIAFHGHLGIISHINFLLFTDMRSRNACSLSLKGRKIRNQAQVKRNLGQLLRRT